MLTKKTPKLHKPVLRICSWNVNGIRAAVKKGFIDWLYQNGADIVGVQETKAMPEQLSEAVLRPSSYESYWSSAEKKGYSGVAVFTKSTPTAVSRSLGVPAFDREGRFLMVEYPSFILMNIYFPNGKKNQERLDFKMAFYNQFLEYVDQLSAQGKSVIICGDFNTAHHEIDLARPRENEHVSGFLPIERAWLDMFVSHGYSDIFRHFYPDAKHQYTWWDLKTGARARNIGWRIDYMFANKKILPRVREAFIFPQVLGSDHCPIGIALDA